MAKVERAFYISDPYELRHFYNAEFDRLYFGAEFRASLLPTVAQLDRVIAFVRDRHLALTLVTPPLTESALAPLSRLLTRLPVGTEVVFNDWGLATALLDRSLTPVHGRLLCGVKRDPRLEVVSRPLPSSFGRGGPLCGVAPPRNSGAIPSSSLLASGAAALRNTRSGVLKPLLSTRSGVDAYFRATNFNETYQRFLLDRQVRRIELDNVWQGYDLDLHPDIRASLYYPFVACSLSGSTLRDVEPVEHGGKAVRLELSGAALWRDGGVYYYRNDAPPSDLLECGVDRTVYMPVFPNRNLGDRKAAFLEWDEVFGGADLGSLWGEAPDPEVVEVLRMCGVRGARSVLELGCGVGRHARLFDARETEYTGVDISRYAIDRARQENPDARFICCDIEDFRAGGREFDLVLDYGCFHSLPPWRRRAHVDRIASLCFRGGHCLLLTRRAPQSSLPVYFVLDQIPQWGFSPEEVRRQFEPAFRVVLQREKREGDQVFFFTFLQKR